MASVQRGGRRESENSYAKREESVKRDRWDLIGSLPDPNGRATRSLHQGGSVARGLVVKRAGPSEKV